MAFATGVLGNGSSADPGDALALAAFALARRCSAGATMWCVAPEWREHARHVAVEFVHPVVIGKPALAAVSVDAPDVVSSLRTLVAPGDVVIAIGAATDRIVRDVVRRAVAWGTMSIWIGAGERPERGAADHVLWVDDDAASAAHDGRLVFQYHVLWELAHVCLEHAGLLAVPPSLCDPVDGVCVTCSDEGRLAEVLSAAGTTASVRTPSGLETVDTTIVPPVLPGDLLLIHAGTAIARLDEDSAVAAGDGAR